MTRKQVYDLLPEDLEEHAVWEYAFDEEDVEGQDEATVRPVPAQLPLDPEEGPFIVAARVTLADGTPCHGYLTAGTEDEVDLSSVQPAVVTPKGQVSFWCGIIAPDADYLTQCYALLGKSPTEVFPLSYVSAVQLVGGPITGSVPGFVVLEDWRSGKTRVVR